MVEIRVVRLVVTVLVEELQRSLEQVQTSAAPFLRHLLLPSNQQPRNSTTATKQFLFSSSS